MNTKTKAVTVLLLVLGVSAGCVWYGAKQSENSMVRHDVAATTASYKDATYVIEGKPITLHDGVSETPVAPGSVTYETTRYFGNEIMTDVNGDGADDVVFLLTQDPGGSGMFYYLVAAIATDAGYIGSNGYFLGDRIAPQNLQAGEGAVVSVQYATRADGESLATPPSVGVSETVAFMETLMKFVPVVPGSLGFAEAAADGHIFSYPMIATSSYVRMTQWPPTLSVHTADEQCVVNDGTSSAVRGITTERMLGDRIVCVTDMSEGAAGSVYHTYTYTASEQGDAFSYSFAVQEVQCMNYDEPERSECQAAQQVFNPDDIARVLFTTMH